MSAKRDEAVMVEGTPIGVIEWSVRDYRNWYKELIARDVAEVERQKKAKAAVAEAEESGSAADFEPFDMIGSQLIDGIKLFELEMMTSLTAADLEDLKPSQIEEVVSVCKKVNPNFFALKERADL
jgi:hypothetical protein